jgi:AAA15 family ATPase/GTPase
MLKELSVKNFKSINEELFFTMEADYERVSELPEHIVDINGNKLLKVASMYGPNGGGKSNILKALYMAKRLVTSSDRVPSYFDTFVDSECGVMEETLFFVDDKYEIGYNFQISISDSEDFDIEEQSKFRNRFLKFNIISELVSFRVNGENDFSVLLERSSNGEMSSDLFNFDNSCNEFKLSSSKTAVEYIYTTFSNPENISSVFLDVIMRLYNHINGITPLDLPINLYIKYPKNTLERIAQQKEKLINLLEKADIKIKDIVINFDEKTHEDQFYFVREYRHNNSISTKEISISNESDGTRKIFFLLINLLMRQDIFKIYFCDDLNAYLHPKMCKAIIEIFQENNDGMQLIFNSHDLINMTNELFRRDEIWLIYKNDNYATQATPLSSIVNYKGEQIRKDSKYYKQYLEGKYGADPFIVKGLNWNE